MLAFRPTGPGDFEPELAQPRDMSISASSPFPDDSGLADAAPAPDYQPINYASVGASTSSGLSRAALRRKARRKLEIEGKVMCPESPDGDWIADPAPGENQLGGFTPLSPAPVTMIEEWDYVSPTRAAPALTETRTPTGPSPEQRLPEQPTPQPSSGYISTDEHNDMLQWDRASDNLPDATLGWDVSSVRSDFPLSAYTSFAMDE